MEKNIQQYQCYHHQQEVMAFDLDPLTETKDKYLCLKCLAIQSPNRQIETIQDAQSKFMEMKILVFKDKEQQSKSNLEKLSNIQNQIKEFLEFFINRITESQKILKQRIQEEKNQLNSLIDPQQGIQTEQDLLDLTNFVNYGFTFKNNQIDPKQETFIFYFIFLQNYFNLLNFIILKILAKEF